jgi:hypothetical protein
MTKIDLSHKEMSLLYEAMQYYTKEEITDDKHIQYECDLIMHRLSQYITVNGMEPAYRSDI